MEFRKVRRQKFLDQKNYVDYEAYLKESVSRARSILLTEELVTDAQKSFRWRIASDGLKDLILQYTAGRPIEELREALPQVIRDFDTYIQNEISPRSETPPRAVADTLEITQLEAYVYVFWLLALCKLSRHAEFIPKVMEWVNRTREFNRGRDILFENVVQALTGFHIESERVALHVAVYRSLARATLYAPEERPALVKEFVENWYKRMKSCYWHGMHTGNGFGYFGYWCFEAALVTVLFDIDDTSYRDHLVYPKDLVNWYRANSDTGTDGGPPEPKQMLRAMPGQPCPRSGDWFSHFLNTTVFVRAGEPMPGPERDASSNQVSWYMEDKS
jgi:Domain of unknown function (DUF1911)/Domain of unknown function (DUF1910)